MHLSVTQVQGEFSVLGSAQYSLPPFGRAHGGFLSLFPLSLSLVSLLSVLLLRTSVRNLVTLPSHSVRVEN